jgi:hypothetical protein
MELFFLVMLFAIYVGSINILDAWKSDKQQFPSVLKCCKCNLENFLSDIIFHWIPWIQN